MHIRINNSIAWIAITFLLYTVMIITQSQWHHLNNQPHFNTMQFSLFPSPSSTSGPGGSAPVFPNSLSPGNGNGPGFVPPLVNTNTITPSPIPHDRTSLTFTPNVFNAGSNSTGLNKALKFYMDEKFRMSVKNIDLQNQKKLLDGSPRTLQDFILKRQFDSYQTNTDNLRNAQSRSLTEQRKLPMSAFTFDLTPTTTATSPTPTTTTPPASTAPSFPTNPLEDLDLPSPALLLNPQVQNQIRNVTSLFGDMRDLFTPSQSTSNLISELARDAPSSSEISRDLSNLASATNSNPRIPPPSSSSSRPPSLPTSSSPPSLTPPSSGSPPSLPSFPSSSSRPSSSSSGNPLVSLPGLSISSRPATPTSSPRPSNTRGGAGNNNNGALGFLGGLLGL